MAKKKVSSKYLQQQYKIPPDLTVPSTLPPTVINETFTYPTVNSNIPTVRNCINFSALNEHNYGSDGTNSYDIGTIQSDCLLQHWCLACAWTQTSGITPTDQQQFRLDIERAGNTIFTARIHLFQKGSTDTIVGNPNIVLKKGDQIKAIVIVSGIPGNFITLRSFVSCTVQPYL